MCGGSNENRVTVKDRSLNILIALVLILIAVSLRIYGIRWGLPDVYEEATPINVAWEMWGWGEGRGFDANPHFFNYPSLIIYLQLIGQGILYLAMKLFGAIDSSLDFRVLYFADKTPFLLLGRMITMLFGAATILVAYRLGLRIAGRLFAIPAAILIAINTFHVNKSQTAEVDVPLAFFILLTLYFAIRMLDEPSLRNYLMTGLALGLGVSTKYTAAFLVLPVIVAHVFALHAIDSKRSRWKFLFFSLALAALVFFITSPYVLLDFSTFSRHLSFERHHMRIGHFGIETSRTWLFYMRAFTDRLLGWPIALAALAGLVYLVGLRRRPWAIALSAFVIPYMLAVSSWSMKADRYVLSVMPVALIFTIGMLTEALEHRRLVKLSNSRKMIIAGIIVTLMSMPILAMYPDHWKRLRPDTRTIAKEWIMANIPSGCFIVAEAYTPELLGAPKLAILDSEVRKRLLELKSDLPNYAVQPIPMFQVQPERADVYYDLSLYEDADIFVISGGVQSRYMKDPELFRVQLAFYETLEKKYKKLIEFSPRDGPGPVLRLYKNPQHAVPFAGRRHPAGPRDLRVEKGKAVGTAELFFSNLGLNYEAFRFYSEALACYDLGLKYPIVRPKNFAKLVLSKTRCLMRLEGREAAVSFLQDISIDAPTDQQRERILQLGRQLKSGIRRTE